MSTLSDLIYEKSKDLIDEAYAKGRNAGGYGEGFEAGKQAEYDRFWDMITQNGTRADYGYAFSRWDAEYIRPNRKIIPTTANGTQSMFYASPKLKKIEAAYFDFSQKAYGGQGYSYFSHSCSSLEEIEDIGLIAQPKYDYAFGYCAKLKTIAKIGANENTSFTGAFDYDTALENITFDGTIGQNISLAQSSLLTVASMDSIYTALKTYSSGTHTLTLHANAWARWDAAKPDIVAQYGSMKNYVTTTKGWATS